MSNNKGFTLIEIIVVLIILGGLATLAMSSYFSWIKRSYATEALTSLRDYKNRMVACIQVHPAGPCSIGSASSDNFTYVSTYLNPIWAIQAQPIVGNRAGLNFFTDVINMAGDVSGTTTCSGLGAFQGMTC